MRMTVALAALLVVTSCASNPRSMSEAEKPSREAVVSALREEGLAPPRAVAGKWEQMTKGKVAGATALATVGAIFGGRRIAIGSGPRNEVPVEGYADLDEGGEVWSHDEKAAFNDPALAMAEAVKRQAGDHGVRVHPESRYSIVANAAVWRLDYDRMSGTDDYRIHYGVHTTVSDGNTVVRRSYCEGASQAKRSLGDWLANDRAEVRKAATAIGSRCADQWFGELGLVSAVGLEEAGGAIEQGVLQ